MTIENRKDQYDLAKIFSRIPVALGLLDKDLKYVYVNEQLARMNNKPVEEHPGKSIEEIIPHISERIRPLLQQVLKNNEEINTQIKTSSSKDGRVGYYDITYYPYQDQDKKVCGVGVMVKEITKEKQAIQYLQEKEELLNKVGGIAKIGGWEVDLEAGGKAKWTKTIHEIIEIEEGETIPGIDKHIEGYLPEYRQMIKQKVQELIANRKPMFFEAMFRTSKGNLKWIQAKGEVEEHDGKVVKLRGTYQDITERKKVEKELVLKNNFFESSLTANSIADINGDITYANKAFLKTWGFKRSDEVVGKPIASFLKSREKTQEIISVLNKENFWNGEFEAVKGDGTKFHVSSSATVLTDMLGQIVGYQSAVVDISERKKAEKELENKTHLLSVAQKIGRIGSWEADMLQNSLKWSAETYRIYGIAEGETLNYEKFLNCVHPEDREYVNSNWQAALNKEPYEVEIRLLVNGEVRWVWQKAELEFNEQGECLKAFGFTQDITVRKKTQLRLEEEESKFRLIAEKTGQLVYDYNPLTGTIKWTGAISSITGYSFEEFQDVNIDKWEILVHPDDRNRAVVALKHAFKECCKYDIEYRFKHKDGRYIFIEEHGIYLPDKDGKAYRMLGTMSDITERKKLEDAIKANERFMHNIFSSIQDGISVLDRDFNIVQVNPAMEKWYGRSMPLVGKKCFEAYYGRDKLCENCPTKRSFESGCTETALVERRDIKGNICAYIAVSSFPMFNEKGEIMGAIEYVRDISEKKQAEEALENLARFPEENPNPVMRIGGDGRIIYANKSAKIVLEAWQCNDNICTQTYIMDIVRNALDLDKPMPVEVSAAVRIFSVMFMPIKSADYVNLYATDVTERAKAEKEGIIVKTRFEELFDSMSSCAAIYAAVDDGDDFVFIDFNKAGEKTEKIDKNSLIGRRVSEIFPGIKDFGLLDVLRRVWQSHQAEDFPIKEYKDERISGWKENHVYRLDSGELVVIYDDVTDKKHMEQKEKEFIVERATNETARQKAQELLQAYQELKDTQLQLIQAEKLAGIGQLGAGIAHELNSPLTGVLSLIRSYKKEKLQSSLEYEDLQAMEGACVHMSKIIKSLNAFSRQTINEPELLDCNEVIESTLSFIGHYFKGSNFSIKKNYQKNIDIIKADKNQIQQVVVNMLTNARDSMRTKGTLTISTKNVEQGKDKWVEMEFADDGFGMNAELIKKIFDPFFTTKRPGGGVGLGLSIVYRIITDHKGKINVQSKKGQGTVFTISLPVLIEGGG